MVAPELFEAVKNYLDITWDMDDGEKRKLEGVIARGIDYLNLIAGVEQDFAAEGLARQLLFDYVRYVRSNAADEFQRNYLPDLLLLQMTREEDDASEKTEPAGL